MKRFEIDVQEASINDLAKLKKFQTMKKAHSMRKASNYTTGGDRLRQLVQARRLKTPAPPPVSGKAMSLVNKRKSTILSTPKPKFGPRMALSKLKKKFGR